MIEGHRETWRWWLEHRAPLAGVLTPEALEALATALSEAAPQGPKGAMCRDEGCKEHEGPR